MLKILVDERLALVRWVFRNASVPISCKFSGKLTWVRPLFLKAPSPIVVRLVGKMALVSDVTSENACDPIDVALVADKSIDVSPVPLRALAPMVCRLAGKEMLTREGLPRNGVSR